MSKPITCVAAMMLVDDGKLSFDDPVAKYIPGFANVKVGVEVSDESGRTDVLGRVVEVISGQSLFQFEKQRLLDPLGVNRERCSGTGRRGSHLRYSSRRAIQHGEADEGRRILQERSGNREDSRRHRADPAPWHGASGCYFVIDRKQDMFFVPLEQTPSERWRIQRTLKAVDP